MDAFIFIIGMAPGASRCSTTD